MSNRTGQIVRLLLALLVGFICRDANAEDKVELRLRLNKGEVYHLRLTVDQHVVQTPAAAAPAPAGSGRKDPSAPQAAQSIDQSLGIVYTMTVDDVGPDGAMTLATKYDSVVFRQKGPAGATEYDSANPPKAVAPSAKPFSVLPGLTFRMTVGPEGTVKSVEGLGEMIAEVVRRLEPPEGPAKASMLKTLNDRFGEPAMKQNLQSLFAFYPAKPVAVGEAWERKVASGGGLPLIIQTKYTLKRRSAGVAEVAIDSKISPDPSAAPVEAGTGKMTYALSGSQHGSAMIDEATGWTRSLTTEQEVSGDLTLDTPGDKDTAVPITVTSKVVMEPVEGK